MGVSTNIYVMFGTKITWDDSFNEAYDNVYDDHDTPFVIFDGMCGDYIVFGQLLWNSGDFRWDLEGGDGFKATPVNTLPEIERQYKEQFVKKFPLFAHLMEVEFNILSFTHFH